MQHSIIGAFLSIIGSALSSDKYGESSKGSGSQRKLDSFLHTKKCPAERAEEITRRIAEVVARDLRPISIVYSPLNESQSSRFPVALRSHERQIGRSETISHRLE